MIQSKNILRLAVMTILVAGSAMWGYSAGQSSASFNVTADVFQQGHGPVTINSGSFAVSYSVGQRALADQGVGSTNFNAWLGFQAQIDGVTGGGGQSGLVAYYPFNGDLNDASGNGYNATAYQGAFTSDRYGNTNSAYSFDGSNDYLDLADTGFIGDSSIAFWFKADSYPETGAGTNTRAMVICGNSGGGYAGVFQKSMDTEYITTTVNPDIVASNAMNDTQSWHHVVMTYNQVSDKGQLYIDGLFIGEGISSDASESLMISYYAGRNRWPGSGQPEVGSDYYAGSLDEIRIYGHILSSNEVATLYNSEKPSDTDFDGMDDDWELTWFNDLTHPADEDYDHDGLNNILESQLDTDPTGRGAPAWWAANSVLSTNAVTTNDFAAVNAGQLKWIATNAYDEIIAHHGSAGTNLDALVSGFSSTNNYQIINLGQLKATAKPFYDRLSEVSRASAGVYPWTGAASTNNFGAANIGQVKHVFSFEIE